MQYMNNFINDVQICRLNQRVAQLSNFREILLQNQDKYQTNLTQETSTSINELVQRINERESRKEPTGKQKANPAEYWAFGERKIFCWVLIFYSHLTQIALQSLEKHHFLNMQAFFPQKSIEFLRYEITAIIKSGCKQKQAWTEQEMTLLTSIVEKTRERYDWRAISFMLFVESKCTCFKALQECREKWCNYLNPKLNKQVWTLEEDYQLFELVEHEGCRWAFISRKFKLNRTEHMVKNRYNAYMKNWKNKRSNVKSKKGLINRILSYLKTRLNKKIKKEGQIQKAECIKEVQSQSVQENMEPNQYSDPAFQESEQNQPFGLQSNAYGQALRQIYSEEKKERKTAQCELPDTLIMVESPRISHEEVDLEAFHYQHMINSFEAIDFKSGNEEMKMIEDDVVRALGCSHFQRALDSYQCDSFEDCEDLSWLI